MQVKATAEEVWDYLQTPRNIVEWWPDCEEIHDVRSLSGGGFAFKWTDKPAGVTCRGEIETVVRTPGEGLSLHVAGDIYGDMTWRVERKNGSTCVDFASDYDLPIRALIPYLSPVRLLRFQQDEADAIVAKVRERFNEG
jgi:hypothetical protein